MTAPDLDGFDSRALRNITMGALFAGILPLIFGMLEEDEPHTLTARQLRRALDKTPPQGPDAYRVVNGYFNPEAAVDADELDEYRDVLSNNREHDLRRWRRLRPIAPAEIAAHRLDLEDMR